MHHVVIDSRDSRVEIENPNREIQAHWSAFVVLALASTAGIGIAICLLEMGHHGAFDSIFYVPKSLAMGIWTMLCDMANACSDFIGFVKRQSS